MCVCLTLAVVLLFFSGILVWSFRAVELGLAFPPLFLSFFFLVIFITRCCKILVANRRAQLIEWMNALVPEFGLPPDSSDEELRELLRDGVVLCRVVNTLIPGVLEASLFFFWIICFAFVFSCAAEMLMFVL